jgi:hypothetical protein
MDTPKALAAGAKPFAAQGAAADDPNYGGGLIVVSPTQNSQRHRTVDADVNAAKNILKLGHQPN